MGTFKNWFNEMATRHVFDLGDDDVPNTGERDEIGLPRMARPGFRKVDKQLIVRDSPEVEQRLNAATEQFGLHWLIGYISPSPNMKELDPDDWQKYRASTDPRMGKELERWGAEDKVTIPPPSPQNTIVYVKPTSRVHNINVHQQIHNMGHAIWLRNKPQMELAKNTLKELARIQQQAHEPDASEPTEAEITIILGRVLGLQMLARTVPKNL